MIIHCYGGIGDSFSGRILASNMGDWGLILGQWITLVFVLGFTGGSDGKESTCNTGDRGLIFGLGRSPGGGIGNPLQYS